jgi:hypothetical protein
MKFISGLLIGASVLSGCIADDSNVLDEETGALDGAQTWEAIGTFASLDPFTGLAFSLFNTFAGGSQRSAEDIADSIVDRISNKIDTSIGHYVKANIRGDLRSTQLYVPPCRWSDRGLLDCTKTQIPGKITEVVGLTQKFNAHAEQVKKPSGIMTYALVQMALSNLLGERYVLNREEGATVLGAHGSFMRSIDTPTNPHFTNWANAADDAVKVLETLEVARQIEIHNQFKLEFCQGLFSGCFHKRWRVSGVPDTEFPDRAEFFCNGNGPGGDCGGARDQALNEAIRRGEATYKTEREAGGHALDKMEGQLALRAEGTAVLGFPKKGSTCFTGEVLRLGDRVATVLPSGIFATGTLKNGKFTMEWATRSAGPKAKLCMYADGSMKLLKQSGTLFTTLSRPNAAGKVLTLNAGRTLLIKTNSNVVVKNVTENPDKLGEQFGMYCLVAGPCSGGNTLSPEQTLKSGQRITSANGAYVLLMLNGTLKLLDRNENVLFQVETQKPDAVAKMQTDGNFMIYAKDGTPLWASKTAGYPNAELKVTNNGLVRIMYGDAERYWVEGKPGVVPQWDDP